MLRKNTQSDRTGTVFTSGPSTQPRVVVVAETSPTLGGDRGHLATRFVGQDETISLDFWGEPIDLAKTRPLARALVSLVNAAASAAGSQPPLMFSGGRLHWTIDDDPANWVSAHSEFVEAAFEPLTEMGFTTNRDSDIEADTVIETVYDRIKDALGRAPTERPASDANMPF